MKYQTEVRYSKARRCTVLSSLANLLLSALKIFAGIIARSQALLADGIHSLSDLISDAVVLVGLRISNQPSDKRHRYGHGKYETLSTVIIGLLLGAAGIGLLYQGASCLAGAAGGDQLPVPGWLAAAAAAFSILVKELLYQYSFRLGKKYDLPSMVANAWHHRSDAFSSVASLLGISGAKLLGGKWLILDPLAAILVSVLIIRVAWQITRDAAQQLLECALPDEQEEQLRTIISGVSGVKFFHRLRTRAVGRTPVIDLHIKVDADLKIDAAHEIATAVEDEIKTRFRSDSIINVHIEPWIPE